MNKKELKEYNEILKTANTEYFILVWFLMLKKREFFRMLEARGLSPEESQETYSLYKKREQEILSNVFLNFTD